MFENPEKKSLRGKIFEKLFVSKFPNEQNKTRVCFSKYGIPYFVVRSKFNFKKLALLKIFED